jgi:FkbM family methyltransferase
MSQENMESAGSQILRAFAKTYPRAVFIEIGANDGVQYDHLRPFILSLPWTGVMVEPVPYVFAQLRDNYPGREGVAFENAAIATADGRVPFYYVRPLQEGTSWLDAIGSLSREEVEKTIAAARQHVSAGGGRRVPDVESRIERAEVPSLTFESLCRKHGIGALDLLLIDAEGYDYEIIQAIDFERHRPRLLIFESLHFSAEERDQSRAQLEGLGYELMDEDFDTWCHDPRADDDLSRCWRSVKRLRPRTHPGVLRRLRDRLTSR